MSLKAGGTAALSATQQISALIKELILKKSRYASKNAQKNSRKKNYILAVILEFFRNNTL